MLRCNRPGKFLMKGELGFFSYWSFGVVFLSEKERKRTLDAQEGVFFCREIGGAAGIDYEI